MAKSKLITDLSSVTNISDKLLEKLETISEMCVADLVVESVLNNDQITEIDIGMGSLQIYIDSPTATLKFKFIPSQKLEEEIVKIALNPKVQNRVKTSSLESNLEQGLVNKMNHLYKELF